MYAKFRTKLFQGMTGYENKNNTYNKNNNQTLYD